MELILVKQLNNTFKVAYPSDLDKLNRLKANEFLMCSIKQPRNVKFHRKFFALINMVYQNQEIYNNVEDLRKDLIAEAGFYEERIDFHGVIHHKPMSISFSSMSQEVFDTLYSQVLDTIVKVFAWDKQEIKDNIEQYF